jgi:hypothetical protein
MIYDTTDGVDDTFEPNSLAGQGAVDVLLDQGSK